MTAALLVTAAHPLPFARRFLARLPFVSAISAAVLLTPLTLVRPE